MELPQPPGVEVLRAKRGHEQVTFADVADHLVDYANGHPDEAELVDRVAMFLATVEDVSHEHHEGHSLEPDDPMPLT